MNKLFLIGNGFDLAHQMKTSYSDFLLGYINSAIRTWRDSNSNRFEDELITLEPNYIDQSEFVSLIEFKHAIALGNIKLSHQFPFFDNIMKNYVDSKWVDIEYAYFQELMKIYQYYEKHNVIHGKWLSQTNTCFDLIKQKLFQYLKTIPLTRKNEKITDNFLWEFNRINYSNVLFLVFNYTDTLKLYLSAIFDKEKYEIINIHGDLDHPNNPIIFGYGDEMNKYYDKIEDLNENEFLRNMKSFGYFQTTNLQRLNKFIDSGEYMVSIMGHSCGLSDRVLLNSVFCNRNCKDIRIFYHQRSDGSTDFTEKTFEISRHFKPDDKAKMRRMILPLQDSRSLS